MTNDTIPTPATAGDLAIEATGLVKHFGNTRAVNGVDLAVPTGSVYGVLGPNGAGKTTTVSMLATLLRPDAGSAKVFGYDVVADAVAARARPDAVSSTSRVFAGTINQHGMIEEIGRAHV